jgi:hypothetical protein
MRSYTYLGPTPKSTNNINSDLSNGRLADAGHNGTDWATPGHRNEPYTGIRTDQGIDTFLGDIGRFVVHTLGDWFPSPSTISQAISNNKTIVEAGKSGTDIFLNSEWSIDLQGAAGGFLLYPNKPNLNMTRRVYAK